MVDFTDDQKKLWSDSEVRLAVIFSFFLQIFLTLIAPLRRRNDVSKWVGPFIWAAYLLADWVATFALVRLSDIVHVSGRCGDAHAAALARCDNELVAFWAPFLLAHLGGPDTITALALEDNELWKRHLLTLGGHLIVAAYVFLLTLPNNHLLAPTILIFLVGIGRYVERALALYRASSRGFSHWTMGNYEKRTQLRNIDPNMSPEEGIDDVKMVKSAYKFFITYNRLFIDSPLNFDDDRNESRSLFLRLKAKDALGIIGVELDLAYDALYTKAIVIHNRTSYIWRTICFFFILAALAIFPPLHNCGSQPVDVAISYVLLVGAAVGEIITLVNIIFSYWMLISYVRYPVRALSERDFSNLPLVSYFRNLLRPFSKRVCRAYRPPKRPIYISQCNMLSYCIRSKWKWEPTWKTRLGIDDPLKKFAFMSNEPVSDELTNFIFTELRKMSEEATDFDVTESVMNRRWDEFILAPRLLQQLNLDANAPRWLKKLTLDDSILIWHVTTDLCYYRNTTTPSTTPTALDQPAAAVTDQPVVARKDIECISNYMFYLLITHPSMVSTEEGTTRVKYQNMCKDTMELMKGVGDKPERFFNVLFDRYEARRSIGHQLHDACSLTVWVSKQTNWEVLLWQVWVNMLSYAASRCSGRDHAQRLVKGGELLTKVWFLMAHLGLTGHYTMDNSHDDLERENVC